MKIVNFPESTYNQVAASGECPHCGVNSYMRPTSTYQEGLQIATTARCEACKRFVLIVGSRNAYNQAIVQMDVHPSGSARDSVDPSVPKLVAEDVSEALRCQFIKSYRATVVMSRRAIQTSALDLGAKGNRLIDQIDDLFANGKITAPLRDFAHEVRLAGNDGAHPDKDGLSDVTERDAQAIIEFTKEYLHHVYVMPAKLAARRPPTAAAAAPAKTGP
jgi:hypothetical protein